MTDTIHVSDATARSIELMGLSDGQKVLTCEHVAGIVLIMKKLNDTPYLFPKGKWATIQHIENGLETWAEREADIINKL